MQSKEAGPLTSIVSLETTLILTVALMLHKFFCHCIPVYTRYSEVGRRKENFMALWSMAEEKLMDPWGSVFKIYIILIFSFIEDGALYVNYISTVLSCNEPENAVT